VESGRETLASDGLRYDAVVVGGGHNGLVCAAYLARAGMKTVVLEWPGFGVSTASYVVSLMSARVVRELDLSRYGYHVYPLDPAYFAPFPDGSGFLLWDDPGLVAEEIGKINFRDGQAYLEYNRELGELADLVRPLLYRRPPDPGIRSLADMIEALSLGLYAFGNRRSISRLVDLMTMSCADFLDRFFVDERVKGALAPGGVIGMWGGPMSPGSAYVLLHHRMGEIDGVTGGWGFVRGGMGGVSEAIAASARAAGAEIRTNAEVAAIDVAGGRATGVTLADGTRVEAGTVVSGAHPQTTLLSLLGAEHLPDELVRELETFRNRSPSAKVNLALSELPDLTAMPGKELGPQHPEIMISPSLEYLEKAWDDAKYGRFSEGPMIDAVIPTTKDPTIAPEGRHIMTCFVQYAPYEPREGSWDGGAREALGDRVVDTINEYAPNFKDSVIERQVLTPYDLEQRFGLIGGNIFQGEMSLDQLFSFRPTTELAGYKSPVDGLYLCGSGTHPGGGVMGIPGFNASKVVVGDHKSAERKRRLKERLASYSRR
jgi:phytoene dehydrogenase-like protein